MVNKAVDNLVINEDICELIGAYIGDGYLGNYGKKKNIFVLGFSGDKFLDDDYLSVHLSKIIKTNFTFIKKVCLYYRKDENTLMLLVYSKKLFNIFLGFGFLPGKKTYTIKIPSKFLLDKQYYIPIIRGIFDTDGCLFYDKREKYNNPYIRISLHMRSKELMLQIHKLLTFLGINVTITKDISLMQINGYKNVGRYLSIIGFNNRRHTSKIPNSLLFYDS